MCIKRVFFFLLVACIFLIKSMSKPVTVEQKTVFVFDLHDVVLKEQYSIACKEFFTHLHWVRYNCRFIKNLLSFGYNKKIKTTDPKKLSIEYATLQDTNDPEYKKYVLRIINPHVINEETAAYIQQLGAQGFMRFAFSNLGEESFNQLQGQEAIDSLFDGKYLCSAHNNYVTKASPQAFKELVMQVIIPAYQKRYPNQLPSRIVMIDDSTKKLAVAQQGLTELQAEHPELQHILLVPLVFKTVSQMKSEITNFVMK